MRVVLKNLTKWQKKKTNSFLVFLVFNLGHFASRLYCFHAEVGQD